MRYLIIFLLLFVKQFVNAQVNPVTIGINSYISYSNSGKGNINPSLVFNYKIHSLYIGPMFIDHISHILKNNATGIQLGYQVFPNNRGKRFDLFFEYHFDYVNTKFELNSPIWSTSYEKWSKHLLYQHYVGYGFNLKVIKGLYATSTFGVGYFWDKESNIVVNNGIVERTEDVFPERLFSAFFRVGLGWDFWNIKKN